jgi:hypothetical protein
MDAISDIEPIRLADPVKSATTIGEWCKRWTGSHEGVRVVRMRDLVREAMGRNHQKKAGLYRRKHAHEVTRLLTGRSETLYSPRADTALRSMIENGQLDPPPDRQPDVVSMIPGDQYVVVADLRSEVGADLIGVRGDQVGRRRCGSQHRRSRPRSTRQRR